MSLAEPINVAGGLRHGARVHSGKLALARGAYRATYADLNRFASQVANAVTGVGIGPGAVVGLVLPNLPEGVETIFGVAKAGVGAATINSRSSAREMAFILQDADCQAVITTHELAPQVEEALSLAGLDLPAGRRIAVGGAPAGWTEYREWLSRASDRDPLLPVGDDALYTLPYTSGTTGKPKGVMLSHRTRSLLMFQMALEYGYTRENRSLAVAPLYHGAGLAFALVPILIGGTTHLLGRFDPEQTLALLQQERIVDFFMVPTMFHAIFGLEAAVRARYDVSSVRTIVSNAAPLPQATKVKILEYWRGADLHETYGSTEGSIVTNLRPPDQLRKVSCVGQPFALTDVRLLDDAGRPVRVGEVGELFSRSPFLFEGYYKREAETRAAMRDGYFSAGDLARQDEEGHFYIVDRKKDMVLSGGVNIYPREIEEVLHAHPAVREVAVIGVPDEYWGEALRAIVSLQPGATTGDAELAAHCRQALAGFKVPRSFEYVEELPRNAAGKILKRELRERCAKGAGN